MNENSHGSQGYYPSDHIENGYKTHVSESQQHVVRDNVDGENQIGYGEDGEHKIGLLGELRSHPECQKRLSEQNERCGENRRKNEVRQESPAKNTARTLNFASFVAGADVRKKEVKSGGGESVNGLRDLDAERVNRDWRCT